MSIEKIFRYSLFVTFFMNMVATLTFLPQFPYLREFGGLPEPGNPFYSAILAIWIFFFGIFYLMLGLSKRRERFFVFIGGLGKSSFAILLAILAVTGDLPVKAAFVGVADFLIAKIFFVWLYKTRKNAP